VSHGGLTPNRSLDSIEFESVSMRLILFVVSVLFAVAPSVSAEDTAPPNIVFILIDDMGWRDVGFAGNTFVETPVSGA
jgi:arylsulfatase A